MRQRFRPSTRRRPPLWRRLAMVDWMVWLGLGVALGLLAPAALAHPASADLLPGEPWHWGALIGAAFSMLAVHSYFDARRRRAWARSMHRVEHLLKLDWRQFERWAAEAYRHQGFAVHLVGGGGADGGVDLVCTRAGSTCLVQVKHWRGTVGSKVAREMFGLMHHHGATSADIVALKGFTKGAKDFARGKPMRLLDGQAAIEALQQRK